MNADTAPMDHVVLRPCLNEIRRGLEIAENGKKVRRPAHLVEWELLEAVRGHLLSRGQMFRAPYPYYLDQVDRKLVRIDSVTPEFARILRDLGLLPKQKHTEILARALADVGDLSTERPVHRLSYMSIPNKAIYLRSSESSMIKVTIDAIEEVPLATDDVILMGNDLADWPTLTELQPHLDELRPRIGNACTRLIPGTPMTEIFTTRWSTASAFTVAQAQQMFLTRFLFTVAASDYSLWPLLIITGPQNGGKSTPVEKILALLRKDRRSQGVSLPKREGDFLASATNRSYLVYDNIDDINARDYDNTLCHLATGADVDIRVLYETNRLATFRLQNHAAFTARVNPFSRSDVMRRMIELDVKPAQEGTKPLLKDKLLQQVLDDRPRLLAEYILRAQNILQAHLAKENREYSYQSEMPEYEAFTLRCADYEGTLPETKGMWTAYMRQYAQSVTTSNPLVFAVSLWLGKPGNSGRPVSPATLFAELQTIYRDTGQVLPYRSPSSFGKNVARNESALAFIGLAFRETRSGRDYIFTLPPPELEKCQVLYRDLHAAAAQGLPTTPYTTALSAEPLRNAGHRDQEVLQ